VAEPPVLQAEWEEAGPEEELHHREAELEDQDQDDLATPPLHFSPPRGLSCLRSSSHRVTPLSVS